jgi:hypothetical protein
MPAGVSAYTALANVTLGSSASTVTFSSISGSYRDLVLIIDSRGASFAPQIRFNSDSGSNYAWVWMGGDGSGTSSNSASSVAQFNLGNFATWANPTSAIFNIMDYSATDKHKTVLNRIDIPSGGTSGWAMRWANTAAISSIQLFAAAGSYAAGSTLALYGVSA